MEDVISFVLAGFALTGSPGPATLGLAAAGATFGMHKSLSLLLGAVIGVAAVMVLTASGLVGLILAQPLLGPAVTVLAAAYMVYLAWRIATAPPLTAMAPDARPPGFGAGLVLGLGNPKAYAAMAALFSGFTLVRHQPMADIAGKFAVLIVLVVVVDIAWLALGSAITRKLRDPKLGRAINIAFAILLIAATALAVLV